MTKKIPWASLGKTMMTPEVAKEVNAAGIECPDEIEVGPAESFDPTDCLYVCVRKANDPGTFQDNLVDKCAWCSHEIIYRPHAPKGLMKICSDCATDAATMEKH